MVEDFKNEIREPMGEARKLLLSAKAELGKDNQRGTLVRVVGVTKGLRDLEKLGNMGTWECPKDVQDEYPKVHLALADELMKWARAYRKEVHETWEGKR